MATEVFLHSLKSLQRPALRVGAALGLYALCVMALFPVLHGPGLSVGAPGLAGLLQRMSGGSAGPAAWLDAAGFRLVFPLLLCGYAIWVGSSLIGAEERSGLLELLLAYPLSRRRLVGEKFAALMASVVLLSALLWVLLALSVTALGLAVSLLNLAAACAGLAMLALLFGALSFMLSIFTGSASKSGWAAGALLAAAYLAGATWLHGLDFLRFLSPFYYAGGDVPLLNGLPSWRVWLLALLAAACVFAAGVGFERRDLAV